MSLAKRIIPCLDVDNGRVVKGVKFVDIRDAGDPVEIARRYDREGADEITFLDITATHDDRATMVHVVEQVAGEVFIPLTVGGGIRTADDIRRMLNAGAIKSASTVPQYSGPNSSRKRRTSSVRSASSSRSTPKKSARTARRNAGKFLPTVAANRPASMP